MKPYYKLLLSDADETIIDFVKCMEVTFELLCNELGVSFQKYFPYFKKANDDSWIQYSDGELTLDELKIYRMSHTFENLDPVSCANRYREIALQQHFLIPHAAEVLQELAKYCRIVIVSNGFGNVQRTRLKSADIDTLFIGVMVSGDKNTPNHKKPHPELFQDAHLTFAPDIPKDQILVIGDSEKNDIAGGLAYGVDTCLFDPENKGENTKAKYRTRDWFEIRDIILGDSEIKLTA